MSTNFCKLCSQPIPWWIKVDGKWKHLTRRYCLTCSPYKNGKSRRLLDESLGKEGKLACRECQAPLKGHQKQGSLCRYCCNLNRVKEQNGFCFGLVGYACWHCGYAKGEEGIPMLDFHHLDPSQKEFMLDVRSRRAYSKEKLLGEMKKCALLCCRCHREVHAGLIPREQIVKLAAEKWGKITTP